MSKKKWKDLSPLQKKRKSDNVRRYMARKKEAEGKKYRTNKPLPYPPPNTTPPIGRDQRERYIARTYGGGLETLYHSSNPVVSEEDAREYARRMIFLKGELLAAARRLNFKVLEDGSVTIKKRNKTVRTGPWGHPSKTLY